MNDLENIMNDLMNLADERLLARAGIREYEDRNFADGMAPADGCGAPIHIDELHIHLDGGDMSFRDEEEEKIDIDDTEITARVGINVMNADFPVHVYLKANNLFNPNPTKQQLLSIMDRYHNGTAEERDKAKMDMLAILDPYVFSLLKQNYPTYTYHMRDMVEHGYEGIFKGMVKYDPNMGAATTFFKPWIIHEFQEYLKKNVSCSTAHYASNLKKIMGSIEYRMKNHMPIDLKDLHEKTGISLKTIQEAVRRNGIAQVSLDTSGEEFNAPASREPQPEMIIEDNETTRFVTELVYGKVDEEGVR